MIYNGELNILQFTLVEFYSTGWTNMNMCPKDVTVKVEQQFHSYIIKDNNTDRCITVDFEDTRSLIIKLDGELYEGKDTIGELLNRGARTKSACKVSDKHY